MCLGKVYTEERVNELSDQEVYKLFNNYEAKLSGQMVKSWGNLSSICIHNLVSFDFDPPQLDAKRLKLIEWILTLK